MRNTSNGRRLFPSAVAALAFGVSVCFAQAPETPLGHLPYTPGLDTGAMDRSADPCVDFYRYACGGWQAANPIPPDQASWDVYRKMAEGNERFLWGILDSDAKPGRGRDATQAKIGDYFAACMDEDAAQARGKAPLERYLGSIAALDSRTALAPLLARLQLDTGDAGLFFGFGSGQDYADATRVIAFASTGGLGLPDRDYYVRDDERSREIRAKYAAHVARTFILLGDAPDRARAEADDVMRIETALAQATLTRVERRDPYKLFHKMDRAALARLTPAFDWDAYLRGIGLARLDTFDVTQPAFFEAFERVLETEGIATLRTYLRWHVAHAFAPYLDRAMVDENFDFYGRTLQGVPQLRPRWKRCVALVDAQLGEALGKEYVRRAFSPQLKAQALTMTKQIEQAMRRDLESLDWMSPSTRRAALAKLATLVNKIGYPDKWRDYSSVAVKRDDFFGNVVRAQRFESHRDLAKIGKPLDRGEWYMTPPTVNAYYDAQMNDINFPAGVLQPPLFDARMDDAPNYGDTGGTIGHELTHGFDDQGRKFDSKGDLRDWWTAADAKAFEERAQCIVDQYASYVVVDDIRINSRLTQGEDIADLGGLLLAWTAWKAETATKALGPRDGLTPEQRFFVGYAQWACENDRPEILRLRAITDPHSPARYRVNGLVVNMPQFAAAFSCKPGQPMTSAKRCRIW
ncbi:MAG TPA: M13 family metallopeptidase [Usitatibacter sp.]|nr:M13 family metallopeptidase [Usitatibacter sp.]